MTVSRHVSDDALADYLEDLLSPDDHAAVAAHLTYCAECTTRHDGHTSLRALLHQAGSEVEPMPPTVASRLDAVLAAEAQARGGSRQGTPISKPRHRHRAGRGTRGTVKLLAAAATVLALVGGGVATYSVFARGGGPSVVAGGPESSTSPSVRPSHRPTTFEIKPGGALADLTKATFAAQVKALVVPRTGTKSTDKPFGTENEPGIAGGPQHCVEQVLAKAHAGTVLDSQPAQLDGTAITLALARTASTGVVRAYAVRGCPGINARIVTHADVRTG